MTTTPTLRSSEAAHGATPAERVGLGRSIAWAGGVVAVLPVTIMLLWALGVGGAKVQELISAVGLSWTKVGIGLGIVVAFAVVVAVVHMVRMSAVNTRARVAHYQAAVQDLR